MKVIWDPNSLRTTHVLKHTAVGTTVHLSEWGVHLFRNFNPTWKPELPLLAQAIRRINKEL